MVCYYKLGRIYEKFKLAMVRKAYIDNDIRKGFLMCLNKNIDITSPISSSTLVYKITSKPIITSLHNHDLIPKYLNNKFNECNDNPIKNKVLIHKIKFGEVGYKFEKYFKNHGVLEGCVTKVLKGKKSEKIKDVSIQQIMTVKI